MIVGLMSTYLEGHLALGALRSLLPAVRAIGICDGPVEGASGDGPPTPVQQLRHAAQGTPCTVLPTRVYRDDAEKRTALLRWAQSLPRASTTEPLWCIWIDGDEIMLWAEWLPDMIGRAEEETGAGGFPLRLVELDGSVVQCYGRVIRGDLVKRYITSVMHVELRNGMEIALPNLPRCAAGGIPVHPDGGMGQGMSPEEQNAWLAVCRPPVHGEPHYLHRSLLRSATRNVERQHLAEARALGGMVGG